MTLAEAIRLSRETGCEFWREVSPDWRYRIAPVGHICEGQSQSRFRSSANWFREDFTATAVIADDWQTAPHEEGM